MATIPTSRSMLPLQPHKQELVWRSASLIYSIDPRTGNNCFQLGAARLAMSWGDAFKDCWETKSNTKSRFSELFHPREHQNKNAVPTDFICCISGVWNIRQVWSFNNETEFHSLNEQATMCSFSKADAWLEIKLGDFYVGSEAKGELPVQLLNTRSGLVVEGLEFRPCI